MPTKREREYYAMGYRDGIQSNLPPTLRSISDLPLEETAAYQAAQYARPQRPTRTLKPKRKLSAWNKYIKANSKKPRFRYRNGKLNLKKMAIAFRKTPAGRKKKRR